MGSLEITMKSLSSKSKSTIPTSNASAQAITPVPAVPAPATEIPSVEAHPHSPGRDLVGGQFRSRWSWPAAFTPAQIEEGEHYLAFSAPVTNFERLGGLWFAGLSPDVFFACLGREWARCYDVRYYDDDLARVLALASRQQLDYMMTAEELGAWSKLPPTVTCCVYADDEGPGFRYFVREEAAQLAYRYPWTSGDNQKKHVVFAHVPRADCVLKLDRSEIEIIAARPDALHPRLKWQPMNFEEMEIRGYRAPRCPAPQPKNK